MKKVVFLAVSALLIFANAKVEAQAQNLKNQASDKRVDVSEHYPLSLKEVEKLKDLWEMPIDHLLGFGVSKEELENKTRLLESPKAVVTIWRNIDGISIKKTVDDFYYSPWQERISFYENKREKNEKQFNLSLEKQNKNEKNWKITYFEIEINKKIQEFFLLQLQLLPVISAQEKQKLQAARKPLPKSQEIYGYAQRLFSSRYVNFYKQRRMQKIGDLFEDNIVYVLSFERIKEEKSYYLEKGKMKESLLLLFPEYKKDLESFIESKGIFKSLSNGDMDILRVLNYLSSEKFPKISKMGSGKDVFEVLEVELD